MDAESSAQQPPTSFQTGSWASALHGSADGPQNSPAIGMFRRSGRRRRANGGTTFETLMCIAIGALGLAWVDLDAKPAVFLVPALAFLCVEAVLMRKHIAAMTAALESSAKQLCHKESQNS